MKATALLLLISTLLAVPFAKAQTTTTEKILEQEVIEAALYGKKDIVEQAIKQGYDVNTADLEKRTALMFAAFNGQTEIIKLLLAAGADVNAQDQIGTSALMFAASAPDGTEAVQLLLDAGAKINMIDNNEHFSALMWAAAEGQTENVKLLLTKGADHSLQDVDGDTAETFATKAGHYPAARAIKEFTTEKTNAAPVKAEEK
jgi:ankyrin repeat protein